MGKETEDFSREQEYKVKVTHLDLFKKEAVENSLYSLILMDRHYAVFNDKFVSGINDRKERVNQLVGRIKTLGEKVNQLSNVKQRMTVVAAKNYPFVKGFSKDYNIHHDEKFEP